MDSVTGFTDHLGSIVLSWEGHPDHLVYKIMNKILFSLVLFALGWIMTYVPYLGQMDTSSFVLAPIILLVIKYADVFVDGELKWLAVMIIAIQAHLFVSAFHYALQYIRAPKGPELQRPRASQRAENKSRKQLQKAINAKQRAELEAHQSVRSVEKQLTHVRRQKRRAESDLKRSAATIEGLEGSAHETQEAANERERQLVKRQERLKDTIKKIATKNTSLLAELESTAFGSAKELENLASELNKTKEQLAEAQCLRENDNMRNAKELENSSHQLDEALASNDAKVSMLCEVVELADAGKEALERSRATSEGLQRRVLLQELMLDEKEEEIARLKGIVDGLSSSAEASSPLNSESSSSGSVSHTLAVHPIPLRHLAEERVLGITRKAGSSGAATTSPTDSGHSLATTSSQVSEISAFVETLALDVIAAATRSLEDPTLVTIAADATPPAAGSAGAEDGSHAETLEVVGESATAVVGPSITDDENEDDLSDAADASPAAGATAGASAPSRSPGRLNQGQRKTPPKRGGARRPRFWA